MSHYENCDCTDHTKITLLRLQVLKEAHPESLTKFEISIKVKALIPVMFGDSYSYIHTGPPYFKDFARDSVDYDYVEKTGFESYRITEKGCERIRYLKNRYLSKSA